MRDLNRHRVSSCNHFLLSATSVLSVSLWLLFRPKTHHRGTENTEVAQRKPFKTSATLELRRALLQKRLSAFLLVLGAGTQPKKGSLKCQALCLACVQSFIYRLE